MSEDRHPSHPPHPAGAPQPRNGSNDGTEAKHHPHEQGALLTPAQAPHRHSHAHVHSDESLRKIVNRLSRIEGHIRGIKTMVQESRPCPDVLIQLAAVRGAVDRVSRAILDEHLSECIARAAQEGNIEAEIEELKGALDRFLP
jgi:DNA-binding FrmR family transcriptional regulator